MNRRREARNALEDIKTCLFQVSTMLCAPFHFCPACVFRSVLAAGMRRALFQVCLHATYSVPAACPSPSDAAQCRPPLANRT